MNPLLGLPPWPDMLPPVSDLVGRDAQLSSLTDSLTHARATAERNRLARLSIYGEAGVGKSALGACFAASIEADYPDGTLYQDLNDAHLANGDANVAQILRRFLLELGKSPDRIPHDAGDLHAEFIKATDSKRLIVFLDNVRSYQSVKDLIPRSATCLVIFTSNELLDHRIPSLELRALDPAPALELFRQIAPSRAAAGTDSGDELAEVLKACAGLTLDGHAAGRLAPSADTGSLRGHPVMRHTVSRQ